jgi:predicted O-methyltransferase YrrM
VGQDSFMQDGFRMRLGLALNRLAENVDALHVRREVEIMVADWGNDTPLAGVLELTESSKTLIKFLSVPAAAPARPLPRGALSRAQALNAAVRRASGEYILVCDDDVYVPLCTMAALLKHLRRGYVHSYTLENSFFWASAHVVPNEFFVKTPEPKQQPGMPLDPSLKISTTFWSCFPVQEHLDDYIRVRGASLACRAISAGKAYRGPGAALLMHKRLWIESTGFDERVPGLRCDDLEFTRRLLKKYRWDDLNRHGVKFFRLGEWPHANYFQTPAGALETGVACCKPDVFEVNPPGWGLADADLELEDGYGMPIEPLCSDSVSENFKRFDKTATPKTVRQILASNPLYRTVAERFAYLPLTWFSNQTPLQAILNALKPRSIGEIGSYMGASAHFFARFPSVAEIFCIDHWDRDRVEGYDPDGASQNFFNNLYEQFLANAVHCGMDDKIVPLRLDSREAADCCGRHGFRFDLIYIDGDHTTVGARDDILRWFPLLNEGGLLCGDDWAWQKEPDNVAGAVMSVAREKGWQVFHSGNFWMALPGGFAVHALTLDVLEKIRPITSPAYSPCESAFGNLSDLAGR